MNIRLKSALIRRSPHKVCCTVIASSGANYPLKHVVKHSPDGFEFGYGRSGPADLALSIMSDYVGQEQAMKYYMALKWKFISGMQGDHGQITSQQIDTFMEGEHGISLLSEL